MDAESAVSVLVSRTLDDLGYSQQMVKCRQEFWRHVFSYDRNVNLAGSKAEGVANYFESDIDLMYTEPDTVCTSIPLHHHYDTGRSTVFQMDRTNVAPGYTRLIYDKARHVCCSNPCNLHASLTKPVDGNIFLSSESWRQEINKKNAKDSYSLWFLRQRSSHGPSNPFSTPICGLEFDFVSAIMCQSPDLLLSWLDRPRRYGWPPQDIIHEITSLEAHVVPIGFKESCSQFLEWRICFTKAELLLVQNLSDCQTKVFLLLKLIARNSLKPVCKDITTYVMKNIILWMAELLPPYYFTEENLAQALQTALRFLRECLVARFVPSYMIPERNILTNRRMSRRKSRLSARVQLISMLDILLAEGPRMLLRCPNIASAWYLMHACQERFNLHCNISNINEIMLMHLVQKKKLHNLFFTRGHSWLVYLEHEPTDLFRKLLCDLIANIVYLCNKQQ